MIFNLRCLNYGTIIVLLVSFNALIRPKSIQEPSKPRLSWLLLTVALTYQYPFKLFG